MKVDTDEFLKSLKSLQVSPCECSAKNPDSDYPNQHTKACPRFQATHCWCPPATGPGQPHRDDCCRYKRPEGWANPRLRTIGFGMPYSKTYQTQLSVMQAQAYAAAFQWMATHPAPIECNACTCAMRYGLNGADVDGHAAFCPLGEKE
jgi:hypothetical protein